jgi:DNA repair protein RecO (recombination protein O)
MRVSQQPAFILHSRHFSETSLILEVFTRDHGRVGLMAKGARRPGNRARSLFNPFQPLLVSWIGRGELPILTDVESGGDIGGIDGPMIYCGFYLNELLVRLLHRHDPHDALFGAYHGALVALGSAAIPEIVLRLFEKRLLAEVGYGLVLDHDISDHAPIMPDALYEYALERGPARVAQAQAPVRGVRVHGASLLALAAESLDTPVALRDAKVLMRAALARHLGGKPLHSRRLYQHVLALRQRNPDRGLSA